MQPQQFLEFAKKIRNTHVIDEETDSRVGIDRSYYAAAHVLWNTILNWANDEMGESTAKDIQYLKEDFHTVIRFTLEKVESPCSNMIRELFHLRNISSYFLSVPRHYKDLKDAIALADRILGLQQGLIGCLGEAFEKDKIDGCYWERMAEFLKREREHRESSEPRR